MSKLLALLVASFFAVGTFAADAPAAPAKKEAKVEKKVAKKEAKAEKKTAKKETKAEKKEEAKK